jgi:hypothetical protein
VVLNRIRLARIQALQGKYAQQAASRAYGGERELAKQLVADSRHGAAVLLHVVLCIAAHHTRWFSMNCFSLEIVPVRIMWFKQAVVTGPANSNCTSVTLYVLFEPVRFFELAVFPSLYGCEHHALTYNTGVKLPYWGG